MKILILGSDGFVGQNLLEDLSPHFNCFGSTRKKAKLQQQNKLLYFDLLHEDSWSSLIALQPDCVINCIVNGAVKKAEDIKHAIDLNYLSTVKFYEFLSKQLPQAYLIHFGTAFEYDLHANALTEATETNPQTYYGISKLLASNFLLSRAFVKNFTIIRPFNLFGPYDKEGKIIPHLISAQRDKIPIALSAGLQGRDYFYVKDISTIIKYLISHISSSPKIINAGSGHPIMLKEIANTIAHHIPDLDPSLWQWDKLPYRDGEGRSFYNASTLLKEKGITLSGFEEAIKTTVAYYCGKKQMNIVC